jgi:predicted RNA-binding protein
MLLIITTNRPPLLGTVIEMKDWLFVLSEDNWEACAKRRLLGLSERAQRRSVEMSSGDRLWVYVNKKYVDHQVPRIRRLRAVARVRGSIKRLTSVPWKLRGDQTFPFALPIELERLVDIDIVPVLKKLSIAGKGTAWGSNLLNAPLRLTPQDVSKLEAAAAKPD